MIIRAKIVALGRLSPSQRTSWWSELMDRLGDPRRVRMVHACAPALIVACLACPAVSLAKPPEAAAERVRLFEWFSALGVPDVKHPRFVRYPHSLDGRPESKLCY